VIIPNAKMFSLYHISASLVTRSWSWFDYSPFITGGQLADLDKSS